MKRTKAEFDKLFEEFLVAIPHGCVKAIHATELAKRLGVSIWEGSADGANGGGAILRALMAEATRRNIAIIGDKHGYYYPVTEGERKRAWGKLTKTITSLLIRRDVLERSTYAAN